MIFVLNTHNVHRCYVIRPDEIAASVASRCHSHVSNHMTSTQQCVRACVRACVCYILLCMHVCFCCVGFSFSVLSREIGWEERL